MKKLIAIAAFAAAAAASAAQVSEVKVRALDRFGGDVGSVLSRCQLKAGAEYDPVTVTRDITALRETREFEDIRAEAETEADGRVAITYLVTRKLRYQAPMKVLGADYLSESKIASESGLKDGYLYGEADLADAALKVRKAYWRKHFPYAKVAATVEMIGEGNDCHVVMSVEEGRRMKVRDYSFTGVTGVEEKELREAINDYPWWNPYGWFSESPVSDEELVQSVSKLEEVFRNHGYLDVKISGPERIAVPEKEDRCDILFTVAEGDCYRIGESSIKGLTRYPEETVKTKSKLPPAGEVAGAKTLEDAAHRIKVTVGSGDSGLADTVVTYKWIPREDDSKTVDIIYQVKEGVPVVIDEVVVRGNDYTKDKVIRREVALGPGDRMLEDRAERSQKRLENLDYFSRVRYYLEPSARGKDANGAEYRNLVYEVEEKNTGSFMVGIGASSVDSVFLSAELSQSNFDLFAPGKWFRGAGQKGRAFVQWGPRIQTIEASVTEPHLFDRLLELTVEGYRRGRWYDEYDLYRNGAAATLSYPVKFWPTWNPFGRFGVRLSGEYIQFDDCEWQNYYVNNYRKVRYFLQQENDHGNASEGVLRLFWSHNTTDNYRMPTTGGRSNVFADFAGGDNSWWRLGLSHRQYFQTWKRFNHVLMVALRAETMDAFSDEVPIYDRMFLGGPRSLRGVKYRNVSPLIRKEYFDSWSPIGGQTLFCMNIEYTIPIVKMLRLAVFSDLGSVGADNFDLDFSDAFAWTVGLGVRLDIPMFPIRLDFATPIQKPDHAEKEVFSFTVGYDF